MTTYYYARDRPGPLRVGRLGAEAPPKPRPGPLRSQPEWGTRHGPELPPTAALRHRCAHWPAPKAPQHHYFVQRLLVPQNPAGQKSIYTPQSTQDTQSKFSTKSAVFSHHGVFAQTTQTPYPGGPGHKAGPYGPNLPTGGADWRTCVAAAGSPAPPLGSVVAVCCQRDPLGEIQQPQAPAEVTHQAVERIRSAMGPEWLDA